MNILVVNDDGIEAKGIHLLAEKLKAYGTVYVCAPDQGRSASSHCILLHHSLSFEYVKEEEGIFWYKTSGMPADCVRLAFDLIPVQFDLIFSGINNGLNVGTDIVYSGTVSAAREAMLEGCPAIAISTDFDSFLIVEKEIDLLLKFIFEKQLFSKHYVLNVNFPTHSYLKSKGYRFTKQGKKIYFSRFIQNEDGTYFNEDKEIYLDPDEDTDVCLSTQGFITFVPLSVEQTNYNVLTEWKKSSNLDFK